MSPVRLLPDGLVRQARGGTARAQRGLAEAFGTGVRGLGETRLRQLMEFGPTRRAALEAIFRQMPRQLDRQRAAGLQIAVRWVITRPGAHGADIYDLAVSDGRASVRRGGHEPEPEVTITVDGAEFLRLVSGNADPMRAYMSGDLAATGDIMAAARMASLFRAPGAKRTRKHNTNTERGTHRAY